MSPAPFDKLRTAPFDKLRTAPFEGQDRLHLAGVVLPEGEHRDLWVVDGVIRTEPIRDAQTLAKRVWMLPGLVDAHCHVGLERQGAVSDERAEEHAVADRNAGGLLLRDAGSPADTRWMDSRADLPKIIRAGRHIARPKRYLRNYGEEVEPEELIAEVERQATRGDGWVKLVGDWIDRDVGDLTPLWPVDVAQAAIARAHELGCRVTAHVFGEQAVTELVGAGIDGIEHGTGIDEATIELMAARQVALVPTMIQLDNFEMYARAGEEKYPAYASHIRALYASRLERFATALDAGVPIYAGTDAGGFLPHGLVGDEIAALTRFCPTEYALGAGSWRAREWLGHPATLSDGVPADLVVFDADPLLNPAVLRAPRHVILRGAVVA
jgi:imidazolonepropionase-like amidohydrolase